VQTCNVGSRSSPVTCTFETPWAAATVSPPGHDDSQGRLNQTQFNRWVSGGQRPPARKVEQEQVTLIPDKETYQPGEVAKSWCSRRSARLKAC
jgi:alpha-2-macroglobulin